MELSAEAAPLEQITPLRNLYRAELNCQIIHDSIHSRPGWSLEYLLRADHESAGYGSIAVAGPWKDKPTIYEFYVLPQYRLWVFDLFLLLLTTSCAVAIETQSNDPMLTIMLHTFAKNIFCEAIVYHDKKKTRHAPPGATFRRATAADGLDVRPDQLDSHGIIEVDGKTAASGGILFHYNPPYGDIYMEVKEPFRRRGLGTYIVQELKRICYEGGHIPAARCNATNVASRKTLQKAGFVPCGNILNGAVAV